MRDEIWNTPLNFSTAVTAAVAEWLATPPMDAVFDTVTTIEPCVPTT